MKIKKKKRRDMEAILKSAEQLKGIPAQVVSPEYLVPSQKHPCFGAGVTVAPLPV